MIKRIMQFLTRYPETIFMAGVLMVAAVLNLQFLDASNINFTLTGHDEYIAVREVYSILNPISTKHFFMAIISGDVLYYGRIMFYTDALFAYIPFKMFGLQGMVFAIRMTHVIFILVGLIILGNTFLKNCWYRMLFYVGTTTLYYSAYFYMVPKPEPIQLLLLAIFFYFFRKSNFAFGRFFVFLGLAYGVKFNIITMVPFILVVPFLSREVAFLANMKKLVVSGFYFLAGLIMAVPCLLLAPVKPVFLKSYLNATFASTGHYDDDASVSMMDWIMKGWLGAYNGGILFGCLLLVLILLAVYFGLRQFIKMGKTGTEQIILFAGLFLFMPILVITKRIWPHYLWTGYILIFLGIIMFLQNGQINRSIRMFSFTLLGLVLIGSLNCSYAQGKGLFALEANSNKLIQDGLKAYRYLRNESGKFTAVQDLSVPYPFEEMIKSNPYHPFSSVLKDTLHQKFIIQGFITPEILRSNHADYILTNRIDFEDSVADIKTVKDSTLRYNNALIRKAFGQTIFYDTAFGQIKVYRVVPITHQ